MSNLSTRMQQIRDRRRGINRQLVYGDNGYFPIPSKLNSIRTTSNLANPVLFPKFK